MKVIVSPTLGVGVADRLGHGQVGLLRRLGGAGSVVARVGVELVGVGDRRRVGRAGGADDRGLIVRRRACRCAHRAHGPDPVAGSYVPWLGVAETKVSPAGSRS